MLATLKRSYILFFDPYSKDEKVHIRDSFITVSHLSSGTGQGLFGCVEKVAEYMGASDWKTKLCLPVRCSHIHVLSYFLHTSKKSMNFTKMYLSVA